MRDIFLLKHATINFAMSILPPPVFYPEMSLFYPINERVNTPKPLILQTSSGHEREKSQHRQTSIYPCFSGYLSNNREIMTEKMIPKQDFSLINRTHPEYNSLLYQKGFTQVRS